MDYKRILARLLAGLLPGHGENDIHAAIELPPDLKLGDFAYPCFRLAKELRKAPHAIAKELAENIASGERPSWLSEARAVGAYLNIYINRAEFAGYTLRAVLDNPETYGDSSVGANRTVVVDFSSPNIAKHFHVGHFANTVIGRALVNIYRALGYRVVGINYLGDWGTQFGKMITAYKRWGDEAEINATGVDGMTRLYVKFHEEAERDESLNAEARTTTLKLENGDAESIALWRWFNDLSLREYNRVYDRLGVTFDLWRGESYYSDKMDAVARELKDKGLLEESDGARIVNLEAYNMPPCLILKSDGGTLYPTRDIASAIDRYNTFHFDKSVYVTANEQLLHFMQWFKVVELMGYPWAGDMVHVTYGLYVFESGKMSTRKGQVFKIEEMLDDAVAKTLEIIAEKNPELPDKERVAEQVGVGALIFNQLYNSRVKDVLFSWERMLNFEGETGPYAQYTHARACSVLERAGADAGGAIDGGLLADDESFEVVRLLYAFPEKIAEAAEKYEPFIISRHIIALAQAFNKFYHARTVLVDEPVLRNARLALTAAAAAVLRRGLGLLGISAPRRM